MDVAIVGVGLHPFGRTASMSGLEQGAAAVRSALADAGTDFKAMQFAFGGSQDGGNADTLVNLLGLTGLQFTNVANGCATGGSSLNAAYSAIKSGQYDVGLVVGFDKHVQVSASSSTKPQGRAASALRVVPRRHGLRGQARERGGAERDLARAHPQGVGHVGQAPGHPDLPPQRVEPREEHHGPEADGAAGGRRGDGEREDDGGRGPGHGGPREADEPAARGAHVRASDGERGDRLDARLLQVHVPHAMEEGPGALRRDALRGPVLAPRAEPLCENDDDERLVSAARRRAEAARPPSTPRSTPTLARRLKMARRGSFRGAVPRRGGSGDARDGGERGVRARRSVGRCY